MLHLPLLYCGDRVFLKPHKSPSVASDILCKAHTPAALSPLDTGLVGLSEGVWLSCLLCASTKPVVTGVPSPFPSGTLLCIHNLAIQHRSLPFCQAVFNMPSPLRLII